jgi:hypothetical protein
MEELVGVVAVEVTAQGSKGERESVVLRRTGEAAPVVLRSRQPSSLTAEPWLSAYAGQRVRVRGQPGWASFVVDEIEAVTDPEEGPDGP